jgi:hypothetical protein
MKHKIRAYYEKQIHSTALVGDLAEPGSIKIGKNLGHYGLQGLWIRIIVHRCSSRVTAIFLAMTIAWHSIAFHFFVVLRCVASRVLRYLLRCLVSLTGRTSSPKRSGNSTCNESGSSSTGFCSWCRRSPRSILGHIGAKRLVQTGGGSKTKPR